MVYDFANPPELVLMRRFITPYIVYTASIAVIMFGVKAFHIWLCEDFIFHYGIFPSRMKGWTTTKQHRQ